MHERDRIKERKARLQERRSRLTADKRDLLKKRLQGKIQGNAQAVTIPQRLEQGPAPLSFAQQRLWFLDQLEPGVIAYNMPAVVRLSGRLDVTALRRSLNQVVRRHEAIRTTFTTVDDQPRQVIASTLFLDLPVIDLRDTAKHKRESLARQLAVQEAKHPFNLEHGPLLRATLLQLDQENYVLLLIMHHIISDGWSLSLLVRELATLYTAFINGKPSPLPELPIQYADFAAWQRQWLQGEVLGSQIDYWRKQLAGVPVLELPTDHPRPAASTFRGQYYPHLIPKALADGLQALSRREATSLFMTLLAAFKTLLYHYTGQEDIAIGTPIANRNRAEIEDLIGFFVNMLVLRSSLAGNPTFQELLARTREMTLQAYAYQDLPFEKLVEELQPERDLSRNPLFQVSLALQNVPISPAHLPDLTLSPFEFDSGLTRLDLELHVFQVPDGLRAMFSYRTDLFEADTITRLAGHFQVLLEQIIANPAQHVDDLIPLTEAERQQVLVEWNDTKTGVPRDRCIHHLFKAQVEQTPDAIAIVFEDEQLTYRELDHRANQLAHLLLSLDLEPESPVAICLDRSPNLLISLLASLKAGTPFLPLDPTYPQERLAFILADAQASTLLTHQHLTPLLPHCHCHIVCLDAEQQQIASQPTSPPHTHTNPHHLAYLIYTSGSTGRPKGVAITHHSLLNYLLWFNHQLPLEPTASLPAITRPTFDAALKQLFAPLLCGQAVWLLPDEAVAQPDVLFHSLSSRPNVWLNCVPSLWRTLLDLLASSPDDAPRPHITHLLLGGEALAPELLTQSWHILPHLRVSNLYGPTETTANASIAHLAPGDPLSIGTPIANTQLYVLDRHLHPVPPGVRGELHVAGTGLARGYLHRPALTAERFIPNPFGDQPGQRLYRTGDLCRFRPDGSLEFLGRLDHQVKVRGFRIELGEIEATLAQHPLLRETIVVARDSDLQPGTRHLVAYLVADDGHAPSSSELRRFLLQKLPEYMLPSAFVPLDALPLTPSGKVDRRALPAPERTHTGLEQAFVAPRTPIEEVLAGIWAEILDLEQVGVHDNFFELGGHSLLATQVISHVRDAFQVDLALRRLFEAPTVAGLADVLLENPATRAQVEQTAKVLVQLAELSDEEVEQMIVAKTLSTEGE